MMSPWVVFNKYRCRLLNIEYTVVINGCRRIVADAQYKLALILSVFTLRFRTTRI